jgi:vacuolar-type H+-ATPase subunit I/STV1
MATNYTDTKTQMRDAILMASIPLMTEAIGLMTDAVKELRAEMERARIANQELAPLQRQLKVLEVQCAIDELKAHREDIVEDRKAKTLERAVRIETAKQDLARLTTHEHVGGEVRINGFDYDA